MTWFRKSMILIHRYLGIALSLLFVVWFISGIGMMYARGMPALTPQVRLDRLTALDLARVRLTPVEAAARADLDAFPSNALMLTVMDRPAYRFSGVTVFADTGEPLEEIGMAEAMMIASRFMNVSNDKLHHTMLTEIDQWTIGQGQQLPLHKITVDDEDRTQLYISPDIGEVVLLTTRGSRALAWVAAIPHWFYFKSLRMNGDLWRQVVLWTSGLGCLLALIGLILGVIQFRLSRPFRLSRISSYIPYSGWMRWHYITGVVFGLFTLTWVFSGMLSMEPWGWASADGLAVDSEPFTGGALDLSQFPAMDPTAWEELLSGSAIKEVRLARIQGDPYYVVRGASPKRLLVKAAPLKVQHEPFSTELLMNRLKQAVPDVRVLESQVLSDYDSYYYSRDRLAPLPVLRVKFDDPDRTWVYIDTGMGQPVGQVHRLDRVERWIYNGFHSLDFSFWYYNRTLWEAGVILLSLGCIISSGIGMFIGFKRLFRGINRLI